MISRLVLTKYLETVLAKLTHKINHQGEGEDRQTWGVFECWMNGLTLLNDEVLNNAPEAL